MENDLPRLALSVRQPWAWAIIHAGKHLENRSVGAIKHMRAKLKTGRICIHAATGMTRDEYESARDTIGRALAAHGMPAELKCPRPDELVRGAIIGSVEVTGTLSPMQSTSPWWAGGHALTLANPSAIAVPIPIVGELGYFEWRDPRCQKRVINRGSPRESEKPAAIADPLPWMRAWPDRFHPFSNAPGGIIKPAPAPLFEDDQ